MSLKTIGTALAAASLLLACQTDDPTDPTAGPVLSERFHLVGEAHGSDPAGRTADCEMHLTIELHEETRRDAALVESAGVYGGHLARTVLEPDGSGISLMPSVFGDAVVTLILPDSLELLFPGNAGSGSRFWEALALLAGTWHDGAGAGAWTCAPFDIYEGGWVDTVLVAQGTWRIEPF